MLGAQFRYRVLAALLDVPLERVRHADRRRLARAVAMAAIDAVDVQARLEIGHPLPESLDLGEELGFAIGPEQLGSGHGDGSRRSVSSQTTLVNASSGTARSAASCASHHRRRA